MDTRVNGSLTVSDDVLADLVGYAPATVQEGIAGLLPAQRLRRGVEVARAEDGGLSVALHVVLEYGVNIAAVSQNLVDAVKFVLKDVAQIDDVEVAVHVDGMKVREP